MRIFLKARKVKSSIGGLKWVVPVSFTSDMPATNLLNLKHILKSH